MAGVETSYAPETPSALYSGPSYVPSPFPSHETLKRSYADYTAETDESDSEASSEDSSSPTFDPEKHLSPTGDVKTHSLEDIGLCNADGVSSVAVSEPFPLFTEEAVDIMRKEIFSEKVQKYSWTSDIAALTQLRGYTKHAPFTKAAWKHPKTLETISKIAGVELVPVFDYEIAHINLGVPGQVTEERKNLLKKEGDNVPIVGWHRDSYPFVCVLMMSDCEGMIGGETALRTGTGEIKKIRGPTKGCGAILQGRYIEHQALAAFGARERITAVTSFRPKNPLIRDDTVLNTVRPISHLPDLYSQYTEYSLSNMKAMIDAEQRQIKADKRGGKYDTKRFKTFSGEVMRMLAHMNKEIVDEEQVKKGCYAGILEAERAADVERAAKRKRIFA